MYSFHFIISRTYYDVWMLIYIIQKLNGRLRMEELLECIILLPLKNRMGSWIHDYIFLYKLGSLRGHEIRISKQDSQLFRSDGLAVLYDHSIGLHVHVLIRQWKCLHDHAWELCARNGRHFYYVRSSYFIHFFDSISNWLICKYCDKNKNEH